MGTPNSPYITIVIISAVLNVLLGIYAYSKKSTFSGMYAFILITLTSAIYAFGFAFELASNSLEEIKRWIIVEYIGIPFIAPLSLVLAIHYIGLNKYLTRFRIGLLFAIPVITLALVATNDIHHLFYRSIFFRAGTRFPMVDVDAGYWYIVHGAYTFTCQVITLFLLIRQWKQTKPAFKKQLITLLAGLLLPMFSIFLYLMGLTPYGMDFVPFIMSITSSLYLWALLSQNMFTIVPIAKDNLFESMRDGVLLLNSSNQLVDYNQAAATMFPLIDSSAIGQNMDQFWKQMTGKAFLSTNIQNSVNPDGHEIEWINEDSVNYYQMRASNLYSHNGKEAGRMIVLIDVTEQKQLQNRLRHLAYFDGLTQIYNRTHFLEQCRSLLKRISQTNEAVSLILFDIDHFKNINDSYGHSIGDQALLHVVSICKNLLQGEDIFARYGGEEFVFCLPSVSIKEAGARADMIRREISSTPMQTPQDSITLTASFGVTMTTSSDPHALEFILRVADKALYRAKQHGRNVVYWGLGEAMHLWKDSKEFTSMQKNE